MNFIKIRDISTLPMVLLFFSYILYYQIYAASLASYTLAFKILVLFICGLYSIFHINFKKLTNGGVIPLIGVFCYIIFLFVSSVGSVNSLYSLVQAGLQVGLLISACAFGQYLVVHRGSKALNVMMIIYFFIVLGSVFGGLFGLKEMYSIEGGIKRFNGMYGEPSLLGLTSGALVGFALFNVKHKKYQFIIVAVALISLVLSGSRGMLLSVVLSLLGIGLLLFKIDQKTRYKLIGGILLIIILIVAAFVHNPQHLRSGSLSKLSGRTELWSKAVPNAMGRLTGFGYCLGGTAFNPNLNEVGSIYMPRHKFDMFERSTFKAALHNGYVQALADLGIIGFSFYLLIFLTGIKKAMREVKLKDSRLFCFFIFFFALANMT
jgi:O-antigen ligase